MTPIAALLQSVLDSRGWTQADLAHVLGWSVQTLSEVMKSRKRLDAGLALDLEQLTPSTTAGQWLELQAQVDLAAARQDAVAAGRRATIQPRARLETFVPSRELIRRRVIDPADVALQIQQVEQLLEVSQLGADSPYRASARRADPGMPLSRHQRTWISLARRAGRSITVPSFDAPAFQELVRGLPHEIRDPGGFVNLPGRFRELGVRLVAVAPLPGGRIDGVSLRLEGSPLIALSGRGRRLDRVLFTLLHEGAHVLRGDWQSDEVQVHEGSGSTDRPVDQTDAEREVDELAASWIQLEGLPGVSTINSATIDRLAERNGLARAVVIGRLQYEGVIPWSSVLSRGLPTVEEALAGWN